MQVLDYPGVFINWLLNKTYIASVNTMQLTLLCQSVMLYLLHKYYPTNIMNNVLYIYAIYSLRDYKSSPLFINFDRIFILK